MNQTRTSGVGYCACDQSLPQKTKTFADCTSRQRLVVTQRSKKRSAVRALSHPDDQNGCLHADGPRI